MIDVKFFFWMLVAKTSQSGFLLPCISLKGHPSLLKCCKQGIVGDQTPRDHIQKFDDESLPGMLD